MRILSLSSFVPEHICDTIRFIHYHGDRNISHYCGYVSDYISRVMYDEEIDGAVFPRSCDSTRIITSYLQKSNKFSFQLNVPVAYNSGSEDYFARSIAFYKKSVEDYYGININDVLDRVDLINKRNAEMRKTYEDIEGLSYADYLSNIHTMLNKPLIEQRWTDDIRKRVSTNKKVYIIGSFLSNIKIVDYIEQSGLTVIGDSLPESGRLISMPLVDNHNDVFLGIAHSILSSKLSPSQNCFADIINKDLDCILKKKTNGVIFIMQQYCEPYEFLYSVYKTKLDEHGIKTLKLLLNNSEDDRNFFTAIEAFADIL